ncbi:hypothetical protein, partial [Legionella israelensis]|uniref:hypothetical protein n=1 Tax=Legionella israelensis TaxID=454 RepID=UPI000881933F
MMTKNIPYQNHNQIFEKTHYSHKLSYYFHYEMIVIPYQKWVKSKKCCKFPLIQPIKLVRYLVKAFIPTTL